MALPIAELSRSLNGVKNVGQAKAAAARALVTMAAAKVAADGLPSSVFAGGGSKSAAQKDLSNTAIQISMLLKSSVGDAPDGRGIGPWWTPLRNQITKGYITSFDVYERSGQSLGFMSGLVEDLGQSIQKYAQSLEGKGLLERAGTIIGDVARETGKGVGAAGKGLSEGAKGAVGDILGPLKWPLLGLGVVAVIGGIVYAVVATAPVRKVLT